MKQYLKKLFSILMLFSTTALIADVAVAPYLEFRSVSRNNVRKLVGTTEYAVYQYDMESFYGTFNITPGYERSFRPGAIAHQLFGSSLVNPNANSTTTNTNSCSDDSEFLVITGPDVANRNATDWDAENFLLPSLWNSNISFKPRLQNIYADFYLYVGLDEWVKGMYFRLYGPVVNNRTTLHAEETIVAKTGNYAAGLYDTVATPSTALYTSALSFFNGDPLPGKLVNATFMPLAFAKFDGCTRHHKTGFADLRGEFGWNYITEDYHVGINIQAAAPTGTRPKGVFLFEPQVGNGKHWELGVGLMGGATLWRCEDDPDKHFDFLVEADLTHMFRAKQTRTFDLQAAKGSTNPNNANSRYMLAQQLRTPIAPATPPFVPMNGAGAAANLEFAGMFQPVANISTRDCKVSVGIQADVVAMFTYAVRGFTWDLGYNFWGRSREKISLSCSQDCNPFPTNWALKGDAQVFGQDSVTATEFVRLAATESLATIHTGTNILVPSDTNFGIDTPILATDLSGGATNPTNVIGTTDQIFTSTTPIVITEAMLDVKGAETKAYTNKVFTYLGYTWKDREDWVPYIGLGVEGEFGNGKKGDNDCPNNTTPTTTNNCESSEHIKCGLSKWAVFAKFGVSFD